MVTPEEFEEYLENHRMGSKKFLELHNQFSDSSLLKELEFFFYAEGKEDAISLADDLKRLNYHIYDIDTEAEGKISVIGATTPMILSDENMDKWVQKMNELGFINDCRFDGWGTLSDQ